MTRTRAISLAIKALEAEIKRLTFNANLHDMMRADTPVCVESSRSRKELRAAIVELRQMCDEKVKGERETTHDTNRRRGAS